MAQDTAQGSVRATDGKGQAVKRKAERRAKRKSVLFPTAVRGRGSWILAALTVPIMAIALLSASLSVALGEAARGWQKQMRGQYTLEIPHRQNGEQIFGHGDAATSRQDEYAREVAGFLEESDEVRSVIEIPEADLRKLVEPWLGVLPPELNLPKLYEVTPRNPEAGLSDRLIAALGEVAPTVRLEQYSAWSEPLLETANGLGLVSRGALVLAITAFVLVILLIVRATLASDRSTVRLLRQMGATDGFISHEVSRFALRTGGLGALGGVVLVAPLLWVLEDQLSGPLAGFLGWQIWLLLVVSPFLAAGLALCAAHLSARWMLRAE